MKMDSDMALTTRKWEEAYRATLALSVEETLIDSREIADVINQIRAARGFVDSKLMFAELGCGSAQTAAVWAYLNQTDRVIGVDICNAAICNAYRVMEFYCICPNRYSLFCKDLRRMPLNDNYIDIVYTGGTIEHFVDIESALAECYRVLKPGGMVFNTVPYLNIGALTYRQRWGNIPAVPVLRQIAEFVHMRLLGGRHMMFGYEMSYTARRLKRLHEDAGFVNVRVERFPVKLVFEFLPTWAVPCATWLATHCRAFWPMVKVIAYKEQA